MATRPPDRRELVARRASELFVARGFPGTRMEDIAAAVGFTARALYRHFPNKHALLVHIAHESQNATLAALANSPTMLSPADQLHRALARLADLMAEDRTHTLLWQREARHLDKEQRAIIRGRVVEISRGVAELIAAARATDPDGDTELLAWAVLSTLASPGHHAQPVAGNGSRELLVRVATALATGSPRYEGSSDLVPRAFRHQPALSSRREQILQASAGLFRRRGFSVVTLEEIGESAGILGPSIYHHFPNKHAILTALVHRLNEWLTLAVLDAQGCGADPANSLDRMVGAYIGLALNFPDLIAVTLTETLHLPEEHAEGLARSRAGLLTEWATLLRRVRPDLTEAASLRLIHAAIAVIDDLALIPHLRSDDLPAKMFALASIVQNA